MMPIVDPHVALSRDGFPLDDYLAKNGGFHVLRMVAVQQQLRLDTALCELDYLRTMSTTRGYGGFPNGVVAYCDLAEKQSLSTLLDNEIAMIVRGVHFAPAPMLACSDVKQQQQLIKSCSWMQELDLLITRAMSLDMTLAVDQCYLLDAVATEFPVLSIIVTLQDWTCWPDPRVSEQFADQIELMAKHDNIHIKLCDSGCSKQSGYNDLQKKVIDTCVNRFGYERTMFASVSSSHELALSFDEQWSSYLDATATYSARHRDKLFRTNAIRVYRL